ncbi:Acetyltransferase (GNAT) family protein [Hathewaya proteolytica DSM 3090]|uniref:Acetyltransferase (GNAT) family protein n=1 Tax=Hathewaya proteolytica DSM 3090 TaxID=1121331 RepID=A0A1M6NZP3_9CLOT|nr:GNAT family N-acetyltransferase [Hathewaya proteolytica]SHK01102.1 Acetyltransferase (GNAT) family protein [Hathewaya proteolytica DSM 3090]
MDIVEFFDSEEKERLLQVLEQCPWSAGKFLARNIQNGTIEENLGPNSKIFFLMNKEKEVMAFLTLTQKDCIEDPKLFPWIGFVYTSENFRGNRYSQVLIKHAISVAKAEGFHKVYLATDHVGLYEKYGFVYMENRMDVWNEDSRIYYIQC